LLLRSHPRVQEHLPLAFRLPSQAVEDKKAFGRVISTGTLANLTMMKLLFISVFLAAPAAHAFSTPSFGGLSKNRQLISPTRRFLSTNTRDFLNDDDDETCVVDPPPTPSSVFGSPLDEVTKRRNGEFIRFIKSFLFDFLFDGKTVEREYARFYALETIAREPYFAYLSVLHFYETLGLWRKADYIKVHFAESWNELHHLLIMEELGGKEKWRDRFVAQHVAFFYYWLVYGLYLLNPTHAYNLNQAVEQEAYETYSHFIEENAEYLKKQPPSEVAVKYYGSNDMYMFDTMHFDGSSLAADSQDPQVAEAEPPRRPKIETLYDVFSAVRDDEYEHVKTMAHLQEHTTSC
jgi:ubiquinol oxidase